MSSFLTAIPYRAARVLDYGRARLIRITTRQPVLKRWFLDRPRRLFGLHLLATVLGLTVALLAPLWGLLLGPIFYGFIHLFASVRYVHYAVGKPSQRRSRALMHRAYLFMVGLSIAYATYRGLHASGALAPIDASMSEWEGLSQTDAAFMLMLFGGALWLYRKSWAQTLLGSCIVGPMALALYRWPFESAGLLVLGHNVVAFIYWIALARGKRGRAMAALSFLIFLSLNLALFGGAFDRILTWRLTPDALPFANISVAGLGHLILPFTQEPQLWAYATVAFALGQPIHYFIWLKAIPDECHDHPVPTTFRHSLKLLEHDFTPRVAFGLIYLIGVGSLLWVFLALPDARHIYFLVAGFHGFIELAGLGALDLRLRREEEYNEPTCLAPSSRTH